MSSSSMLITGGVAAPASGSSPVMQSGSSLKKLEMSAAPTKRDEQREFIVRFIQRYIEDSHNARGGYPPITRSEQQEMESVLYSVSFGK